MGTDPGRKESQHRASGPGTCTAVQPASSTAVTTVFNAELRCGRQVARGLRPAAGHEPIWTRTCLSLSSDWSFSVPSQAVSKHRLKSRRGPSSSASFPPPRSPQQVQCLGLSSAAVKPGRLPKTSLTADCTSLPQFASVHTYLAQVESGGVFSLWHPEVSVPGSLEALMPPSLEPAVVGGGDALY